jgi:hypothetical protein
MFIRYNKPASTPQNPGIKDLFHDERRSCNTKPQIIITPYGNTTKSFDSFLTWKSHIYLEITGTSYLKSSKVDK